ncbi:MAG: fatty acid--CoA ligase family protein [Thermoleophilaceae bacterium]
MRRFEPGRALELLAAERITSAFLGPDMLNRLTAHAADAPAPPDLSQLRAVMSGGTDLPSELADRVDELLGPGRLFDLYGTVETGLVTVAGEGERRCAPGSVGRPLAGVELRILASDGSPVRKGTAGQIAVRAPTLVEGYLEEPEATAEAFTDGFFAPGDVGRTDEEGHLFVLDRVADVIHVAGVEILPSDVERVLREDPAVLDAAAVARADSEGGERVGAAVEARPGMCVDTDALLRRCAEVLPRHAVPDVLEVVEELPRTALGKVVRRTVREHLLA